MKVVVLSREVGLGWVWFWWEGRFWSLLVEF